MKTDSEVRQAERVEVSNLGHVFGSLQEAVALPDSQG